MCLGDLNGQVPLVFEIKIPQLATDTSFQTCFFTKIWCEPCFVRTLLDFHHALIHVTMTKLAPLLHISIIMTKLLSLLLLLPTSATAYSVGGGDRQATDTIAQQLAASSSRRQLIHKAFVAAAATSVVPFVNAPGASAAVYVDPDRYGDKELKSATVNRLRQTIRDVLLKDATLAPCLLKIAIYDALTYNASTNEGGPNGSVVSVILSKDPPPSLVELRPAAEALVAMYNVVKRTTETTMADIVAFAGSEAIESFGGPKSVVQLGKLDLSKGSPLPNSNQYPDLFASKRSGQEIVGQFAKAGLNERDIALLFGAIGSMERVLATRVEEEEEEEEENEMGDKAVFIPSSFGAPSEIYGKSIGKMDQTIFVEALADIKSKRLPKYAVFGDEGVGKWVAKYSDKKGGFLKDLPYAYNRLTSLGTTYTGGKIDALLGTSDE